MLIDWFTVIAQIVNFLVLVGLLKYFLYDRILRAMDEREKRIRDRLEDARSKKAEAEQEQKEYRDKLRDLEDRKQEMLDEARTEAESRRRDLMEDARKQADQAKQQWLGSVEREKESFLHELRTTIGKEAVSLARNTLKDLADEDLSVRVTERFIREIQTLSDEQIEKIKQALDRDSRSITVKTATPIADDQRETLRWELTEMLGEDLQIQFRESPELFCGAALSIPGHKIAWSLQGYLDSLEETVSGMMEEESRAGRH